MKTETIYFNPYSGKVERENTWIDKPHERTRQATLLEWVLE